MLAELEAGAEGAAAGVQGMSISVVIVSLTMVRRSRKRQGAAGLEPQQDREDKLA